MYTLCTIYNKKTKLSGSLLSNTEILNHDAKVLKPALTNFLPQFYLVEVFFNTENLQVVHKYLAEFLVCVKWLSYKDGYKQLIQCILYVYCIVSYLYNDFR